MSGIRGLWNNGQAVTIPELQRMADAAAAGDDLAFEALTPMANTTYGDRRVLPIQPEDEGGFPQLLVAPGTAGQLTVRPAVFQLSTDDPALSNVRRIPISARLRSNRQSAAIASNASGSPRTDLLYATVQWSTTVSAARKSKNAQGVVGTETLALERQATVTLGIAQGTTSAPADSATAWNFPLAEVTVPDGYTSGTTILDAQIVQVWTRAFVPPTATRRLVGVDFGAAVTGALQPVATAPDWSRFGSEHRFVVAFKHVGESATEKTLADRAAQLDWRNRLVRFSMVRAVAHSGAYPAAHDVTAPGASLSETSSWLYTGTANGTVWTSARGFVLAVNNGSLRLSKPTGDAPTDGSGDHWLLIIEATDRFV